MLRITVQEEANSVALLLEGKLAGDWVGELRTVLANLHTAPNGKNLVLTLTEVCGIDAAGLELLSQIHREGAVLTGSGLAAKMLIEEITGR